MIPKKVKGIPTHKYKK